MKWTGPAEPEHQIPAAEGTAASKPFEAPTAASSSSGSSIELNCCSRGDCTPKGHLAGRPFRGLPGLGGLSGHFGEPVTAQTKLLDPRAANLAKARAAQAVKKASGSKYGGYREKIVTVKDIADVLPNTAQKRQRNESREWAAHCDAAANGSLHAVLRANVERNALICGDFGCGAEHNSNCRARDMVSDIVRSANDGELWEMMVSEWNKKHGTSVNARKRLLMEWHSGCSVDKMTWLLKMMGRDSKECGRRARDAEVKRLYAEVDEFAKIRGLPGDVEGCAISIVQGVRIQMADLESQGLLNAREMPVELEYRFSFDGTILTNGGSLVVVAIVPINLPVSCQSRAAAIPIALLRCGEDRDKLKEALADVLFELERCQSKVFSWHGGRTIVMSQSYDLASWWKILQQAWNSNEGCCPMCNANKHNLHRISRCTNLPSPRYLWI